MLRSPLAAGFEFLWLCPAYGNQAAMFKELVETNPIANIGESNSLVLPEYQGSFVSTVATYVPRFSCRIFILLIINKLKVDRLARQS
jgi:hypothetical protein